MPVSFDSGEVLSDLLPLAAKSALFRILLRLNDGGPTYEEYMNPGMRIFPIGDAPTHMMILKTETGMSSMRSLGIQLHSRIQNIIIALGEGRITDMYKHNADEEILWLKNAWKEFGSHVDWLLDICITMKKSDRPEERENLRMLVAGWPQLEAGPTVPASAVANPQELHCMVIDLLKQMGNFTHIRE